MANSSGMLDGIKTALARLSDRERKLVLITVVAVLVTVVGGGLYAMESKLDSKARRVRDMKTALAQIRELEGRYKAAELQESQKLMRLRSNNVSLFSELQRAAGQLGLTLNDLNERQVPVKDSSVTEVSVEVNLKQVSIDKLNSFLEKIEGRSSSGLVKILKLKVKTRHDNAELLDVNMTVATWKTA